MREQVLQRLGPGRSRHERAARLVVGDLGREVVDLVLGDVRRVRHDEREPAAQLAGQRVEPGTRREAHAGRGAPGDVGAGDVERVGAHVGGPDQDVGELGVERDRDRTRARAQVGNGRGRLDVDEGQAAAARAAQPVPLGFLERDFHDLLGLRTRDEHPPVDHEVEAAERPRAEHVLERFPADAALDERREARERRVRAARWSAIVGHSDAG